MNDVTPEEKRNCQGLFIISKHCVDLSGANSSNLLFYIKKNRSDQTVSEIP